MSYGAPVSRMRVGVDSGGGRLETSPGWFNLTNQSWLKEQVEKTHYPARQESREQFGLSVPFKDPLVSNVFH